jgi:hypothetical protein
MRDFDVSKNENPAFKSWKWMISDDDEEDEDNDKDKD